MPFRIETDPTLRRACGTDGPAWASAYMANQTKFDGDARHIELAAWFDAAIAAGRRGALTIGAGSNVRNAMIGQCSDDECGHRWVVVWLPMEMMKAATLMERAGCPLCGNRHVHVGEGSR